VLVVTRYRLPEGDADEFRELARPAVEALAARPGCEQVRFGRNADEPGLWVLASSWRTVGDYRRALSSFEVKLHAVPLMYRCVDEPTAYEDLITWDAATGLAEHTSDRAEPAEN
jgi:Antibiotic biosynthesis monooxygenase